MSGHIREKSLASETVSEYKKYEKKEDWRSVMRYGMYTLGRNSMERFREVLPEYVLANCGRNGVFVVGAAAKDGRIIGLTQFFVRMLPKDDAVADIELNFLTRIATVVSVFDFAVVALDLICLTVIIV